MIRLCAGALGIRCRWNSPLTKKAHPELSLAAAWMISTWLILLRARVASRNATFLRFGSIAQTTGRLTLAAARK